jgi:hypothetical protein
LGRAHLLEDEGEKAIAFLQRALEIFGQSSPRGEVISDEIEVIRAML